MSTLNLFTSPAFEPVTTAEIWAHLRVNLSGSPAVPDDAALIAAYVAAARTHIDGRDGWLGRAICPQVWDMSIDAFPPGRGSIWLALPPVRSITSITYLDSDGASQTLATTVYQLGADKDLRPRIDLKYGQSWPTTYDVPDAVTVRFAAGYSSGNSPDDASGVPFTIKAAIMLMVGHMYENREEVVTGTIATVMPKAVERLLMPYYRTRTIADANRNA